MIEERHQTTIGDVLTEFGGEVKTGPFGTALKASEYSTSGVPVISVGEIGHGMIHLHDRTPFVDEAVTNRLPEYLLREGDIVFARKGSVDRTALIGKREAGWFLGSDGIRLRLPSTVSSRFVRYWIGSPIVRDWLIQNSTGSTMASLNQATIKRLPISLPSLDTQKAISRTLGALDDKIELNRRMSATLEEMARALYRSWFVDFDPVHALALGQPPAHMNATTAALFPDSFGPDGLPKGWEKCPLSQACTQVKKTVKPMAAPDAEFLHFSLPAFDAGRMPVREEGAAIKSNKAHVPHDTILFSRLNPSIPRVWWARTEGQAGTPAASTEFFVAAAHDPVATPWLYCLLSSLDFRDEALSRVTGTSNSHQRIPPKALAEIEVIAPQAEVVEAFGELSGPWFEKVHAMAQENQTLATLRDTLIPRLMSGELRIREAEKQVEEVA